MKIYYAVLISLGLGCCRPEPKYAVNVGTFPDSPANMGDINSEYDDYNSASPIIGNTGPLCFSSNRNSKGKDFDIVYKLLDVIVNRSDGKLTVAENTSQNLDVFIENSTINDAMTIINTSVDQLGPYLIPQGHIAKKNSNGYEDYQIDYIVLYASNDTGNLDIKFTQNLTGTYSTPQSISFLNSPFDDAYPTLTADSSTIYFCSNRSGNFDIYKTSLSKNANLLSGFTDVAQHTIAKDTILSTTYDDKCPFIMGNLMVFTSNRPGGYGGFDLYYSVLENGKWSSPLNFGDKINTAFDEYRPIVKIFPEFTNDFMIFSSNRPAGKGGFDLYYVGINKMAE